MPQQRCLSTFLGHKQGIASRKPRKPGKTIAWAEVSRLQQLVVWIFKSRRTFCKSGQVETRLRARTISNQPLHGRSIVEAHGIIELGATKAQQVLFLTFGRVDNLDCTASSSSCPQSLSWRFVILKSGRPRDCSFQLNPTSECYSPSPLSSGRPLVGHSMPMTTAAGYGRTAAFRTMTGITACPHIRIRCTVGRMMDILPAVSQICTLAGSQIVSVAALTNIAHGIGRSDHPFQIFAVDTAPQQHGILRSVGFVTI